MIMKPEELEYNDEYLTPESAIQWMLAGNECKTLSDQQVHWKNGWFFYIPDGNGSLVGASRLKPILPDPHAEIKAEYEQAIADGKIVKVFECLKVSSNTTWKESISPFAWPSSYNYKLIYYRIDFSKLLSWSYSFGEGKEKFPRVMKHQRYGNIYYYISTHLKADEKPFITNMKLIVYNNETQQRELVNIPDSCLTEIKKDTNDS